MKKILMAIILVFTLGCSSKIDEKKALIEELYHHIRDLNYGSQESKQVLIEELLKVSLYGERHKEEIEKPILKADFNKFYKKEFIEYFSKNFTKEELEQAIKLANSPIFSKLFGFYNDFSDNFLQIKQNEFLKYVLKGTEYSKVFLEKLPTLNINGTFIVNVKYLKFNKIDKLLEFYDFDNKKYSFNNKSFRGNFTLYNITYENEQGINNVIKGSIYEYYFK